MEELRTRASSAERPVRTLYPPAALLPRESEVWRKVISSYLPARGIDATWLRSPEAVFPFIADVERCETDR